MATWAILAVATHAAHAAHGGVLEPGAEMSDCRSALRPGPSDCAQRTATGDDGPAAAAQVEEPVGAQGEAHGATRVSIPDDGSTQGRAIVSAPASGTGTADPIESRVDAFLADYGKPPREAVRALLEPSDANIRAYLEKQQETVAMAAYVAARMTAMQARERADAADAGASLPLPDPAALLQMRVTLFQKPGDRDALEAVQALRTLAARVPSLQVHVAFAGTLDVNALRGELAQLGSPFTAEVVDAGTVQSDDLPYVRIDDLRLHRWRVLDAEGLSAGRLQAKMIALRRASTAAQARELGEAATSAQEEKRR
jgi:hypothetical protein